MSFIMLIALLLTTSSCNIKKYYVTYVFNNGEANQIEKVGKYLEDIPSPEKQKYIFEGWYLDEELSTPFDITKRLTGDITLYAKYDIDKDYFVEYINNNILSSFLTVSSFIFESPDSAFVSTNSRASGVIIKKTGNKYYFLTNKHTLLFLPDVHYQCISLIGKSYTCELVSYDAKYDLALLTFETADELAYINIAKANPSINDDVIAIGNPNNQKQVITFGNVTDYTIVPTTSFNTDDSNIDFETIKHTAEIAKGSSGGPLLNTSLELVGINYATGTGATTGKFISGHAIPQEKIYEFLFKYFKL